MRTKAHRWGDVLEALHDPDDDDRAWASRVTDVAKPIFGDAMAFGFLLVEHSDDCRDAKVVLALGPPLLRLDAQNTVDAMSAKAIRDLYYPRSMVTTLGSMVSALPPESRSAMQGYLARWGAADAVGITMHPVPGSAAVLYAGSMARISVPREKRRLLTQFGLHLEAMLRLRRRPENIRAVVFPNGRVDHRERGAPDKGTLQAHALRIEHVRSRRGWEAIDWWPALLDGSVSFVERREGSRRFYLVLDNPPAARPLRALTDRERNAVAYAARGLSTKMIGYALGLSGPSVSMLLGSAAAKIGIATRLELVRLAAMFARDPRANAPAATLTDAEREVLDLLAQGLSNREIARERNRSVRTIANQVAMLLKKTDSPNRRSLVVRTSEPRRAVGP